MTKFYENIITRTCVITVDIHEIFNITKMSPSLVGDMLNQYVKVIDEVLKKHSGEHTHVFSYNGPLILRTDEDSKLDKAIEIANTALDLYPTFIKRYGLLTFNQKQTEEFILDIETVLLAKKLNEELANIHVRDLRAKI